jgi:hypothetical protein
LLGIDLERSHEFQREISLGCEGIKPGWVRVNFNYFITDELCDYLVAAVHLVAADGWRLLTDYRFDAHSGLWHHRAAAADPPLRLTDVGYDEQGNLSYRHTRRIGAPVDLAACLAAAKEVFAAAPATLAEDGVGPDADFEALRWFPLPRECVTPTVAGQ